MVPASSDFLAPCSSADAIYMAIIGKTAPFIVIDVEILFSGIPANNLLVSSTVSIATPAIPTSAIALLSSES